MKAFLDAPDLTATARSDREAAFRLEEGLLVERRPLLDKKSTR